MKIAADSKRHSKRSSLSKSPPNKESAIFPFPRRFRRLAQTFRTLTQTIPGRPGNPRITIKLITWRDCSACDGQPELEARGLQEGKNAALVMCRRNLLLTRLSQTLPEEFSWAALLLLSGINAKIAKIPAVFLLAYSFVYVLKLRFHYSFEPVSAAVSVE